MGDEVAVAYGNRYAADQFHAVVPPDLGGCNLVAAGGVAGLVVGQHAQVEDATVIQPLGLLCAKDKRVNMADVGIRRFPPDDPDLSHRPHVVAVLGTSMNSGKTTTAAYLVHGLTAAG